MTGEPSSRGISRRGVLIGAGGVAVAAVGVSVAASVLPGSTGEKPGGSVTAAGPNQAGIARPPTPQRRGLLAVFTLPLAQDRTALRAQLAALGRAILDETDNASAPGDLTITVGIGPRIVSLVDPTLPGAEPLPAFAGDDAIVAERVGGDLLLALYSSESARMRPALARIAVTIPDAVAAWEEQLVRNAGTGTITRNPLGYLDGIMVPHGTDDLAENVWIATGPAAGGTVCVIRRLRLDIAGFGGLPIDERDAVIGRHRVDGTPLSGGNRDDEVDLRAKTETGEYLTPAHAHVRAAHPSFTGSKLMLRRGYAFGTTDDDRGLMFVCFQNDLDTFVKTQNRLDEVDALMPFASPTGSASFLVLPGFSGDRPLGSSLFAA